MRSRAEGDHSSNDDEAALRRVAEAREELDFATAMRRSAVKYYIGYNKKE
jgi:hypothetical protein